MTISSEIERLLVGRAPEVMVPVEPGGARVHPGVRPAFLALQAAAAEEGLALDVVSGFRDLERQLAVWNQKARGERPLLDAEERPLRAAELSPEDRMFAILRWSALPGASRHHWGTEVDVFDRAALPPGRSPELRRDETVPGAVFERLHRWLDRHLTRFGFFRPYQRDRGGVSPEPWHLSHVELAPSLQAAYSLDLLERVVRELEIELKAEVLSHLEEIYRRFVVNVEAPFVA